MNTTLGRIALAAPFAALLFGLGIGAAEAAPYQPSDSNQFQQKPNGGDVVIDDFDSGEPEDPPVDPPVDPPAEEPVDDFADDPGEDDGDDTDEGDEESEPQSDEGDDESDTSSGGQAAPAGKSGTSSKSADDEDTADATEGAEVSVQTASQTTSATGYTEPGVQVPVFALVAGGVMVAAVTAWAGYRRHRALAL